MASESLLESTVTASLMGTNDGIPKRTMANAGAFPDYYSSKPIIIGEAILRGVLEMRQCLPLYQQIDNNAENSTPSTEAIANCGQDGLRMITPRLGWMHVR
ncbi:hypothetical protein N7449_000040 [Penicillium cf. viridicatum]|uniref:Uncharacterized protein n=1 Tax=Penicillium cf. viridicatum TaxID=2972119 RepID=A0A9W9T854_9EURO|nr:hypothetical protein N7449_000040 [Penicillium cf. viridicatum]